MKNERKERQQAWAERNTAQAGPSEAQAAKMTPVQGGKLPAQPDDSVRPLISSVNKPCLQLTPEEAGAEKTRSKMPVESFAGKA